MASRSQQRIILLVSSIAAVTSLGVIGYTVLPALFGSDDTQTAKSFALPPAPKKKSAPTQKKTVQKPAKQKKASEPPVKKETSPSVIKSAEAAVQEPEKQLPKKEIEAKQQDAKEEKPIKTASVPKKDPQPEKDKNSEAESLYDEPLPSDIYVPPDIKIPTRKPKVPKARRLKKTPKGERVRTARLSPLKRSQLPPWRRYAARVPYKKGDKDKPKIVIVIDDMGIDRKRSKKVVALPGPLTLSYLTYAKSLYKQTRAARKAGHEIMLHVAMEPANMKNDPGPRVLLRDLEPDEIERRLVWGLGRLRRYVGINNHMGSKFTSDRYGMTIVMKELRRRGLLFLDSRTTNKSVGAVIAHAIGVPYAERNIFLDNVNKFEAVQDRLAELEGLARRRGKAIAIGHPRDATINALKTWLDDVKSRGFRIVPITKVILVPKIAR